MKHTEEVICNEEFVKLISENKVKLYKTAIAILKNNDDVEDAIQEAILSAYKNIGSLRNIEYFSTWIITILRNKCIDIINKNKKVINLEDEVLEYTNEKYFDEYREESIVELAINSLEDDLREITVLYYFDEFSVKEIATITNIPEETVKSRLSRIREKLKMYIEKEEGEYNG